MPDLLGSIEGLLHGHYRGKEAGSKIIHQFLELKETPGDVLQVLHRRLLKMHHLTHCGELAYTGQLRDDLGRALEIVEGRYLEYFRSLGDEE